MDGFKQEGKISAATFITILDFLSLKNVGDLIRSHKDAEELSKNKMVQSYLKQRKLVQKLCIDVKEKQTHFAMMMTNNVQYNNVFEFMYGDEEKSVIFIIFEYSKIEKTQEFYRLISEYRKNDTLENLQNIQDFLVENAPMNVREFIRNRRKNELDDWMRGESNLEDWTEEELDFLQYIHESIMLGKLYFKDPIDCNSLIVSQFALNGKI